MRMLKRERKLVREDADANCLHTPPNSQCETNQYLS